jgi:hypothetical protein
MILTQRRAQRLVLPLQALDGPLVPQQRPQNFLIAAQTSSCGAPA